MRKINIYDWTADRCEELRDWLCYPVRACGFLYATNSHIAIRIQDDPEVECGELDRISERIDEWISKPTAGDGVTLELPPFDPVQCENCGHKSEHWKLFTIGESEFKLGYLRMLAELPNARLYPTGPRQYAICKFDGGYALLMPMRDELKKSDAAPEQPTQE